MKRLLLLSFALILAGSVLANTDHTSRAKVTKAVLTGTVYDINHAVIVSSEVVAQSVEGKEYCATTNTEGVYRFELPLATYRIEANAPGFCSKRIELVTMRNSRPGPLDFVLEIKPSDGLEMERRNRPCAQKTMIRKEQPGRKPEVFRSIAE